MFLFLPFIELLLSSPLPIILLIFAVKKKKNPRIWSIIGTIILAIFIVKNLSSLFTSPLYGIQSISLGLIMYFGMKITPDQKDTLGSKNTSNQKKAHMRNDSKHPLLDQYKREHGM